MNGTTVKSIVANFGCFPHLEVNAIDDVPILTPAKTALGIHLDPACLELYKRKFLTLFKIDN